MGKSKESEREQQGSRLKGRLKGVRKRKQARPRFQCHVMSFKMRLVKTEGRLDR